jgi:cell division inhibitor SepF
MSALRRAGVWLGLVEDEDDLYDEEPAGGDRERRRARRHYHHDRAYDDDDFGSPGDDPDEARHSGPTRTTGPGARRRAGEGSVRPLTREPSVSYLTRDNLALAPRAEQPAAEPERRYQITTLHPTTYREARTIGEHFREGTPVIMNLTEMDEADARRLVDFGAGLAFGLRGTMERVTNRVFLLSPADVQVTPEDKAKIAEGGFFHRS